ncbi:MAG: hypothetical protein AB3N15_10735 [Paracoccaceae bacterium]
MLRIACIFIVAALPVLASIDGQSEPRFQNAVALWLEGEDQAASEQLRELAYEGNTAAQIFLGRIAAQPYSYNLYSELSRQEARELTRAQGPSYGRFGTSWLDIASETEPLAKAFRDATKTESMVEAVPVLLEYGEAGELLDTLNRAYSQDLNDMETLLNSHVWPTEISAFTTWLDWDLEFRRSADEFSQTEFTAQELREFFDTAPAFDPANDEFWIVVGPDPMDVFEDEVARNEAARRYSTIEAFSPIHAWCKSICGATPEEYGSCTMAINVVATSKGPFSTFFGPVQSLLDSERYTTSSRFSEDMMSLARSSAYPPDLLERLDGCLFQHTHGPK